MTADNAPSIMYEPNEFIEARSSQTAAIVAGRPYNPTIEVEINSDTSIINATLSIIFQEGGDIGETLREKLTVRTVTGGITNALYCVSGFDSVKDYNSVLVRVFGAEGMIDRDVETCAFAALSDSKIAPPYYGRFGNGRLEGFLDNYVPLKLADFQVSETYQEIAVKMAELHSGFTVPNELKKWHNEEEPGLWGQLDSWMEQAKNIKVYKRESDNERAASLLDLDTLGKELNWVKTIISDESKVGFSHNDLLPANIMKNELSGAIKLIDFEYGGVNFVAFDIANHFNEWAGGTDNPAGKTDYSLLPSVEQQREFISSYVRAASCVEVADEGKIESLMSEVKAFLLANHLYWGLWAVNQAAVEGTEEFDYLAYAVNRFNRFFETKE